MGSQMWSLLHREHVTYFQVLSELTGGFDVLVRGPG